MRDDLISRQALKQAMYHEAFEVDSDMQKWDGGCWIRYKLVEKTVDSMPSVQPEQKTGRWELAIGYDPKRKFMCDQCARMAYEPSKYCPNCGAKMESEKE